MDARRDGLPNANDLANLSMTLLAGLTDEHIRSAQYPPEIAKYYNSMTFLIYDYLYQQVQTETLANAMKNCVDLMKDLVMLGDYYTCMAVYNALTHQSFTFEFDKLCNHDSWLAGFHKKYEVTKNQRLAYENFNPENDPNIIVPNIPSFLTVVTTEKEATKLGSAAVDQGKALQGRELVNQVVERLNVYRERIQQHVQPLSEEQNLLMNELLGTAKQDTKKLTEGIQQALGSLLRGNSTPSNYYRAVEAYLPVIMESSNFDELMKFAKSRQYDSIHGMLSDDKEVPLQRAQIHAADPHIKSALYLLQKIKSLPGSMEAAISVKIDSVNAARKGRNEPPLTDAEKQNVVANLIKSELPKKIQVIIEAATVYNIELTGYKLKHLAGLSQNASPAGSELSSQSSVSSNASESAGRGSRADSLAKPKKAAGRASTHTQYNNLFGNARASRSSVVVDTFALEKDEAINAIHAINLILRNPRFTIAAKAMDIDQLFDYGKTPKLVNAILEPLKSHPHQLIYDYSFDKDVEGLHKFIDAHNRACAALKVYAEAYGIKIQPANYDDKIFNVVASLISTFKLQTHSEKENKEFVIFLLARIADSKDTAANNLIAIKAIQLQFKPLLEGDSSLVSQIGELMKRQQPTASPPPSPELPPKKPAPAGWTKPEAGLPGHSVLFKAGAARTKQPTPTAEELAKRAAELTGDKGLVRSKRTGESKPLPTPSLKKK